MTTKPRKAAKAKPAESLLVELRTEELPPKSLERLSSAFAESLTEALRENNFLEPESSAEAFATPRRLAVRISRVLAKQPDRVLERKGPSVQAGLDARGQPTQALLGFARACKTELAKLERRKDEKGGEYFVFK
ncbi:MAG: glycine--tRNA ligase subunit beta, partial [Sulfurifustis sp.]